MVSRLEGVLLTIRAPVLSSRVNFESFGHSTEFSSIFLTVFTSEESAAEDLDPASPFSTLEELDCVVNSANLPMP